MQYIIIFIVIFLPRVITDLSTNSSANINTPPDDYLCDRINDLRISNNQPKLGISAWMKEIARLHADNLDWYHDIDDTCYEEHTWHNTTYPQPYPWTPCFYFLGDNTSHWCMLNKGREISNGAYQGDTIEIVFHLIYDKYTFSMRDVLDGGLDALKYYPSVMSNNSVVCGSSCKGDYVVVWIGQANDSCVTSNTGCPSTGECLWTDFTEECPSSSYVDYQISSSNIESIGSMVVVIAFMSMILLCVIFMCAISCKPRKNRYTRTFDLNEISLNVVIEMDPLHEAEIIIVNQNQ